MSGSRGEKTVPAAELFRHTFTGLPGSLVPNRLTTLSLVIDFGTEPLDLPDGMLGWGVLQLDGRTGSLLVQAPNAALQTADALDTYSPGPASAAS